MPANRDQLLESPIRQALELLLPGGIPQPSPSIITSAVSALAGRAYEAGSHAALMGIVTSEQAATELGITRTSILRRARKLGIGWEVNPRCRLFTAAEVEMMR